MGLGGVVDIYLQTLTANLFARDRWDRWDKWVISIKRSVTHRALALLFIL